MWPLSVPVKLDPPFDLHSNVSSDLCVLSWAISSELEPIGSLFSYELAFKRQEEAWEVIGSPWGAVAWRGSSSSSWKRWRLWLRMCAYKGICSPCEFVHKAPVRRANVSQQLIVCVLWTLHGSVLDLNTSNPLPVSDHIAGQAQGSNCGSLQDHTRGHRVEAWLYL